MTLQQREKILKQVLPALGILVLYFAVISHFVTEKHHSMSEKLESFSQKGVNSEVLQQVQKEQQQATTELNELQEQATQLTKELESISGVMLVEGKSGNQNADKVATILAENNLEILEEKPAEKKITKDQLPRVLRDTDKWLKEMLSPDVKEEPKAAKNAKNAKPAKTTVKAKPDEITVWTIHYIGSYLDNYRALISLEKSDINVLPLSLTMQTPKTNVANNNANRQEWVLTLWL